MQGKNSRASSEYRSATIRAAGRSLKNTTIAAVGSVGEATEMLRADAVDAFALTHDALPAIAARLPSGMVRRAFDDAGLKDLVVTPPSAQ
jgi:hypothetical protein